MKYFIYIFLGISSFGWAAEGDENKHPNIKNTGSGSILEVYPKVDPITRKVSELELTLNYYNGFVENYVDEINNLTELGFFEEDFAVQNESVMQILHNIFSNKNGGENWNPISFRFKERPQILLKDMEKLQETLIGQDAETNKVIKSLLREINSPFFTTQWMVVYYWQNKSWFFKKNKIKSF